MDKECFQNQFRGIFEDLHLVQALQCGILQLLYQEMTVKIYIRNEDCFLSCRENNQILKMQVLWVLSRFEALRLTSSNSEPSRPPMAVWDEKGDRCHLSVGSELSRNTWDYYNTVTSSQSFFGLVAHSSHGLHTQYSQLQHCYAAKPWGKDVGSTYFSPPSSRR